LLEYPIDMPQEKPRRNPIAKYIISLSSQTLVGFPETTAGMTACR